MPGSAHLRPALRPAVMLATGLLLSQIAWQGCAPARPWNQVLLLGQPKQGPAAERALRELGPEGFEAVLLAARAIGPQAILQTAFRLAKCPGGGFPIMGKPAPGEAAARLALQWLAQDPSLGTELARSGSPAERSLLLGSSLTRPSGLAGALEAMEAERDPALLTGAMSAADCGLLTMVMAKVKPKPEEVEALLVRKAALAKRLEQVAAERSEQDERPAVADCRDPAADSAAALLAHSKTGRLELAGSSASNDVLSIGARIGDREVSLGPACALWLYEQAARAGTYLPGLLTPVVGRMGLVEEALRRKAAGLLARDAARYPAEQRNRLLALAIDAGADSSTPVTWDAEAFFPQTIELEAAARQGDAGAERAIARAMLCRATRGFATGGPVPLLGFLPAPEAADLAYRIGRECEGGATAALIALLRLGDPRAVELTGAVLDEEGCCPADALFDALREHAGPEVLARIERAARRGNQRALRLLRYLGKEPTGSGGGR